MKIMVRETLQVLTMAVLSSPLSSTPILSPRRLSATFNSVLPSHSLSLFNFSSNSDEFRRSSFVVSSYKLTHGFTSSDKKALLERYGYDPDEFLSDDSSPEQKRSGRGSWRQVPELSSQDPKPPRTIHKLLQAEML